MLKTEVAVLHGHLFETFLLKKQCISAVQINYKRYIRIQLTYFFPGDAGTAMDHPTIILANMGWLSGITVGLGLWLHHLLQDVEAEICSAFENKTPCKSVCCVLWEMQIGMEFFFPIFSNLIMSCCM